MNADEDIGAFVDAMSRVVGLPIDPAYREAVVANFARARQIALAGSRTPTPDHVEGAPVFRP